MLINEKNSIISKELLYQKASEIKFNISDDFVNGLIANDVSFQNNNVFDTALFSGYMARLGLTVNDNISAQLFVGMDNGEIVLSIISCSLYFLTSLESAAMFATSNEGLLTDSQ